MDDYNPSLEEMAANWKKREADLMERLGVRSRRTLYQHMHRCAIREKSGHYKFQGYDPDGLGCWLGPQEAAFILNKPLTHEEFGKAVRRALRLDGEDLSLPPPEELGERTIGWPGSVAWLAIRSEDPLAVISQLGLKEAVASPWEAGLEAASELHTKYAFVSPAVQGRVFVVSDSMPPFMMGENYDPRNKLLNRLARAFPEVQYFITHEKYSGHAWALFQGGERKRSVAIVEGDPGWIHGPATPIEEQLGIADDPGEGSYWPTTEDVMKIASSWGLSPVDLEAMQAPTTTGYLAHWPSNEEIAAIAT